jgi:hypothetical protein
LLDLEMLHTVSIAIWTSKKENCQCQCKACINGEFWYRLPKMSEIAVWKL